VVPVESGVEELHATPSIEDEAATQVPVTNKLRATVPHVDIGKPSVGGHEPGQLPLTAAPLPPRPACPCPRASRWVSMASCRAWAPSTL
jgi:DNA polymerase-3 subunit gamma/tau